MKYLLLLVLLVPFSVQASSVHNYVCGDFDNILTGGSCVSNVFTFNNQLYNSTDKGYIDVTGTWYVSFTESGGNGDFLCSGPASCTNINYTGSITNQAITVSATGGGLYFFRDSGTNQISNLCTSPWSGGCEGAPAPGGGIAASILGLVRSFWW